MKPIENIYTSTDATISSLYNVFGDETVFYRVKPFTDINFKNYSTSHFWSALNMYNEIDYNIANTSIFNGGLLESSFQDLPTAFWSNGMIVAAFNNDKYRTQLNGYNFGIQIPLNSSSTGLTNGLTATTLYSAFIWDANGLSTNPTSLCAGVVQDTKIAESNVPFTDGIGIGKKKKPKARDGENPKTGTLTGGISIMESQVLDNSGYHNSGIVYLVSDDIYNTFTGGTGSSLSWSYGFGRTDKYAIGANAINTSFGNTRYPNYYDSIVGMLNLNSGMVYIWNKDLVNGFDWSSFVGDPLTGATTSSGTTFAAVQDIDLAVNLNIEIISKPGEWPATTNPSAIGENCGTVVTNICLYNDKGDLIGLAKPSEALTIPTAGYLPIKMVVPISGAINDTGIWSTRGLISGYDLGAI